MPVLVGILYEELAAFEQELLMEVPDVLHAQFDSLFSGEPPWLLENRLQYKTPSSRRIESRPRHSGHKVRFHLHD